MFKTHSMSINIKRVFLLSIVYTSLEMVGLLLSTLGFFESDIRVYVVTIVIFHIILLPFIVRQKSKVEPTQFGHALVYIYITVIFAWSTIFTSLMYIDVRDITVISLVLILCASVFIIEPKVFRSILVVNYIFYAAVVKISLADQLAVNSLWFKGLLFYILAYLLGKILYEDKFESFKMAMILKEHNLLLSEQTKRDSLSGLYNNAYIYHYLEKKIKENSHEPLSVLMMDIDNFKSINDTYGHLFGDLVIKEISKELIDATEEQDIIGRYGGEEFIVILNEADIERTIYTAEIIRTNIEEMTFEYPAKVTISIGIAFYNNESAIELIKKADDQLYRAKSLGKNRVVREEEER